MIGIDLRCLPSGGSVGAGVEYASRMIASAILDQTNEVILYVPAGAHVKESRGFRVELADNRRASLVKAIQHHPCDRLFVPSGAVPIGMNVPCYPWVHDVDIFNHPEWFPQRGFQRLRTTWMFKRGLERVPVVFAVSKYTKNAVLSLIPSLRASVTVTYQGGDEMPKIDAVDAKTRLMSQGIRRPFVLIFGTLEPRKNVEFMAGVWPEVASRAPGYDLVIAGRDGWGMEAIQRSLNICKARLESYDSTLHRLPEVSDDLRRDLLSGADLVLLPSFSEGFGRVALEAIQAGTPVLASDRSAIPEITGSGDWLLDPEDHDAWSESLAELLTHHGTRELWAREQSANIKRFNWSKTAQTILDGMT